MCSELASQVSTALGDVTMGSHVYVCTKQTQKFVVGGVNNVYCRRSCEGYLATFC